MKNIIISVVIALIIVGSGAFYGGMKYGVSMASRASGQRAGQNFANLSPEERQQRMQQFGGASGGMGMRGTRGGGGFAAGEIIAKDDKSITIKLSDGGSKIIFLSSGTHVAKSTDGSQDDLAVGKQVVINGSANQDGSVTAQTVQLRPDMQK